ncbi:MAG: hypothetical protein ACTS1Z_14705 [Parasphingopyxis sp.]|uniref:hypothetical protein n=1 Tax=Parasphingopyxis sp. TaxID=1920299 RepID=UPI003F9FDFF7
MTELAKAVEAFVSPEFNGWAIDKGDGEIEPFDPLMLFQSFIESEIPLPPAMKIFDGVAERLKNPKYQLGSKQEQPSSQPLFSFELIRSAVIDELVNAPDEQAAYWLSNYDGMFGMLPDEEEDDDQLIDPRNAANLRDVILEVIAESGQLKVVHRQSKDLFIANVTKYLRYCGFHRIDPAFLKDFVRALCLHSSKSVLFLGHIDNEQMITILDHQEELLQSLKLVDEPSRANLLKVIVENFSRALLNWSGHIAVPSAQSSQVQLSRLLKDAQKILDCDDNEVEFERADRALVCRRLCQLFEGSRLQPRNLFIPLDSAIEAEANGNFREMASLLGALIKTIRSALSGEYDTSSLELIERSSDEGYAAEFCKILDRRSIDFERESGSVRIQCDYSFHTILSLGRYASFSFFDGFSTDEFDLALKRYSASTILVCIAESELSREAAAEIETKIIESKAPLVVIPRSKLEKHLSKGHDVRDLIVSQIALQFPFILSWEADPFETNLPEIPASISNRDKSRLKAQQKLIEDGRSSSACQGIGAFFESRLRSYALFVRDTIASGRAGKGETVPIPRAWDIGGCTWFLKQVSANPGRWRGIEQFLIDPETFELLNRVRKRRNLYQHHDLEVEQITAERFLVDVWLACGAFRDAMGGVRKVVSFPDDGKVFILDTDENAGETFDLVRWDQLASKLRVEFKFRDPQVRVLGYAYSDDPQDVSMASATCPRCQSIEFQLVSGKKSFCSTRCDRFTELPSDWLDVITIANSSIEGRKNGGMTLEKSIEGDGQRSGPSSWLKPIGEGLAQALGPFGAPLKVFLSKSDSKSLQRLEDKVDKILAHSEIGDIDQLLQHEFGDTEISAPVTSNLAFWIHSASRGNHSPISTIPFSASLVSENEMSTELSMLYEGKAELFRTDIAEAGVPLGRIRWTGTLDADIRDVITSLRGAKPETVLTFCTTLAAKNPGSNVLSQATENIEEFLR